jgi:hypothetical protein
LVARLDGGCGRGRSLGLRCDGVTHGFVSLSAGFSSGLMDEILLDSLTGPGDY